MLRSCGKILSQNRFIVTPSHLVWRFEKVVIFLELIFRYCVNVRNSLVEAVHELQLQHCVCLVEIPGKIELLISESGMFIWIWNLMIWTIGHVHMQNLNKLLL